jgi:hypothetical protein
VRLLVVISLHSTRKALDIITEMGHGFEDRKLY